MVALPKTEISEKGWAVEKEPGKEGKPRDRTEEPKAAEKGSGSRELKVIRGDVPKAGG